MNIFSFIKSHVSILDVAREYTTLKRAGGYWKGHCPFHHEKTASFTVSPHKEIYYCFGCHEGGDAISFIEKVEQCSPFEAATYLGQKYNIDIPEGLLNSEKPTSTTEDKNRYYTLCNLVAQWCYENLQKNPSLLRYIAQRGFDKKNIDYFTMGFFPGGPAAMRSFIEAMRSKNILVKDLVEANIVSEGRTTIYSPFEERLMFPIKDHMGRFCGFGGRIYKEHDTRPKYYNSRENEYFSKGTLLFGLDLAKKEIQKTNSAFLVEGYTDCIAMVQHGFANTVATLGTACTSYHLKQLSRYAQQLYVLYDNDTAGNKAILRLTEMCWQVDLELKIISLPLGHDPASFLQKKGNLQELIDKAQDIFIHFIGSLGEQFHQKPLAEKVRLSRKMVDVIRLIDDKLKQDFLLQKAAKIFDIPFKSLKHELEGSQASSTPKSPPAEKPNNDQSNDIEDLSENLSLEKKIFCAILNNVQTFSTLSEHFVLDHMPNPLRVILEKLKATMEHNTSADFTQFFNILNPQEKQYVSKLLLEHEQVFDELELEHLLLQFQKKQWKIIVQDIKKQLDHAKNENNTKKVDELLRKFLALKQQMLSPR
jgi:DNA primase